MFLALRRPATAPVKRILDAYDLWVLREDRREIERGGVHPLV
jgi:hypothetical protein